MVRLYRFPCITALPLVLASCATGPDFQSPPPPQGDTYTSLPVPSRTVSIKGQEHQTQEFITAQAISRQWWAAFQSEALSHLIDRGLRHSPTLQAAQAALAQAHENLKAGMGGFFPSVDVQVNASRQKASRASSGVNAPPVFFNLYNASLNVSYNADIFGALRRQVEALEAEVDYQRFELEAAYLTLTSNIVTTAVREASLRAQIQATQDLIASQEKQLQIIRSQQQSGSVSYHDVLTQETLVAQTRATLPPLESALAQTRHALAVLVGEIPGEAKLPAFSLETLRLPTELPVTLPSSLIGHRPDIQAAEALLHQASAQIGVAKANLFPQLTLTGSVGSTSPRSRNLLDSLNVWNVASQLLQPIFRGGELIAKENAAIAAYDQAFAQYRQTVLQAFQQVADVLQALAEDAKTHKAFTEAEHAAHQALKIAQKQYKLGAISFLALLDAERQYQETRLGRLRAEASRYTDTAALFQALGGDCFTLRNQPRSPEARENTTMTTEAEP